MKKRTVIIVGGTGQYGITLGNLLDKKKFNVIITGRNIKKISLLKKKYPKLNFTKLSLYNKIKIKDFLIKKKTKFPILFCWTKLTKCFFEKKKRDFKK